MTSLLAPGGPGIAARWTSSAKIGVGTALSNESIIWFTISHGIINEVYWPRIDVANIRDMEFIVTDGKDFFSEEKRHAVHDYTTIGDGIPAYHLINTCNRQRYRIEKRIIADPVRSVLLQEVEFIPLEGMLKDYKLFLLLAPHLRNSGMQNTGWVSHYKGQPMLFATSALSDVAGLAATCSVPFKQMTAGFVGSSDAWTDLSENKQLTRLYEKAENGNIALAAEIDLEACNGRFVIALAFGLTTYEAGLQCRASLSVPFSMILDKYVKPWEDFQNKFDNLSEVDAEGGKVFRMSNAVLKIHQGKRLIGSVIASLSIPWGFAKGDNDIGGYHLIWPRDQVQTAAALLAGGDFEGARKTLLFLMCSQEEDGHWVQCMWEDGTPYWPGLQMDETGLPVLLADVLNRHNALHGLDPTEMARKAAVFILKKGPVTQEDRWEEEAGYTPFTLAVEITALLAAADFLASAGEIIAAEYLRETADWWNESIDRWLYVKDTPLAKECGVEGYYVRVLPAESLQDSPPRDPEITLANLPEGQNRAHYSEIISVDALALVRYGVRSAKDPKILNTIKVIDKLLKKETTRGPIWHRYNRDGYGEHEDGAPFDGTGVGRGWPLLVGERAMYELAAGNFEEAKNLLRVMARYAGVGELFPEQIWDAEDIPGKSLFNGHSAGSAKPLVWAHAEYITLLRSIKDGIVFTMHQQACQRYQFEKVRSMYAIWKFNHQLPKTPSGKRLRIQTESAATIHWSQDNWQTTNDLVMTPLSIGLYYGDLPTEQSAPGTQILFTFFWHETQSWEGKDYSSVVV